MGNSFLDYGKRGIRYGKFGEHLAAFEMTGYPSDNGTKR
jgi:hypothetical protein